MSSAVNWLSPATVEFLAALRSHNDRDWFAAHKADYEDHLKYPAEQFAAALASELAAATGKPHDYRIFRIHRDVRFAKDKTPYSAHLHISLSPEGGCREGGPVWMFGLDPDGLNLGAGGTARTTIINAPGGPESLVEANLGAAASLRLGCGGDLRDDRRSSARNRRGEDAA